MNLEIDHNQSTDVTDGGGTLNLLYEADQPGGGDPGERDFPQDLPIDQEPDSGGFDPRQTLSRITSCPWLALAIVLLAVVLAFAGLHFWNYLSPTRAPTMLRVDAHISAISSWINGTVTGVYVEDNQRVRAGQLLVQLDPHDYEAFVIGIIWELFQRKPVVDLRLFRNRNFAVSALMMFALGFVLYGTTVLLPEFVQALMRYTAEDAGRMLSPGGLVIMAMMPLVGVLLARIDARWLIAAGFGITALALYHMAGLNLEMNWRYAMMLRVYQSMGLAFLFVPINTICYNGIEPEKNNQVSGLMNLMRNVGGSVGISLSGAMVTSRAQFHQYQLVQSVTAYNPRMHSALQSLAQTLHAAGMSTPDALNQAYGRIYSGLQAQAQTLAYIDTFWIMAMAVLWLMPLVFLLKKMKPGAAPAGGH